jgi:hypothetical protein
LGENPGILFGKRSAFQKAFPRMPTSPRRKRKLASLALKLESHGGRKTGKLLQDEE